jgi:hypothetical protein
MQIAFQKMTRSTGRIRNQTVNAHLGAPVEQSQKAFAIVEDFHFVDSYVKHIYLIFYKSFKVIISMLVQVPVLAKASPAFVFANPFSASVINNGVKQSRCIKPLDCHVATLLPKMTKGGTGSQGWVYAQWRVRAMTKGGRRQKKENRSRAVSR